MPFSSAASQSIQQVVTDLRAHPCPEETMDTHVIHLLHVAGLPREEFRAVREGLGIPGSSGDGLSSAWSFARSNAEAADALAALLTEGPLSAPPMPERQSVDVRQQVEQGITQALEALGTKPRSVTFQDAKVSVGLGSAVEARHVARALKAAGLAKVRTVKTYDGARIVHGTL